MISVLTTKIAEFSALVWFRDRWNPECLVILDKARYEADGDWELWQDEGEVVG